MKPYIDQFPDSCCLNCIHSFDVEFFEGIDLRCTIGFIMSAKQLSSERMTSKNRKIELQLKSDTSRRVGICGICDDYKQVQSLSNIETKE